MVINVHSLSISGGDLCCRLHMSDVMIFLFLWLGIISCFCSCSTHVLVKEDFSSYTFEQYLEDFEKSYDNDINNNVGNADERLSTEYDRRRAIFESNLAKINRHNNNNQNAYNLGVNAFTDLLEDEIPIGYDKHLAAYLRQQQHSVTSNIMQDNENDAATATVRRRRDRRSLTSNEDWMTALGSSFTLDVVNDLPDTVDWRLAGITTAIKSQGHCGSCWAFASAAVLESHVALATNGVLFDLSVQQLVSCVDNPHHCGGIGGCTGSTSELAFEYVQKHGGIVEEWSFGYQSFNGENISCSVEEQEDYDESSLSFLKKSSSGPVASIDGWIMLPRNNYQVVMNVLAKVGPLVVAVACLPWILYHSGIYPHGNLTTQKETDLNHLVVLEGYGTDEDTGLDYWLVRNSWGPKWGEYGYIRLERLNPSADAQFCGMDTTPNDGEACTMDDNGHAIQPPPSKICGNSGILYDVSFPIGAHLV